MNGAPSFGTQSPVKASVKTIFRFGITSRYWPGQGMSWPSGLRMVTLLAPPGRRSTWAAGTVQGWGANHCLINSGVVQQRNSLSAGGSSSRGKGNSLMGMVFSLFAKTEPRKAGKGAGPQQPPPNYFLFRAGKIIY